MSRIKMTSRSIYVYNIFVKTWSTSKSTWKVHTKRLSNLESHVAITLYVLYLSRDPRGRQDRRPRLQRRKLRPQRIRRWRQPMPKSRTTGPQLRRRRMCARSASIPLFIRWSSRYVRNIEGQKYGCLKVGYSPLMIFTLCTTLTFRMSYNLMSHSQCV